MHVAVVGGGLAGLVAAHDLLARGIPVTLLDERPQPGGQIRTRREDGFVIDDGAEGFLPADPDVRKLCDDLGITDLIIPQANRRSLILSGGTLSELSPREAAALIGIPVPATGEPQGIASLRGGMGTLVERLVDVVRRSVTIRQGVRVTALAGGNGRWRILLSPGEELDADAVLLAVPPPAAARLLSPLHPGVSKLLGGITHHSNVSVSLACPAASVAYPLDAGGFVVAPGEGGDTGLRACAFCSSKFPDRAPAGEVLLRAFFRPAPESADPDVAWVDRAMRALAPVLGISGGPTRAWVAQWPAAIPQPGPAHAALVEEAAAGLRAVGAVELVGAAYVTGGVPGAVRSGRQAVRNVTSHPLPA